MLIALDYDETYSLDPEFWNDFIINAKEKGHDVICVTMRFNSYVESEVVLNSIGKLCTVIFTERMAKKRVLIKLGIFPDVWIDDRPYYIYEDSRNI